MIDTLSSKQYYISILFWFSLHLICGLWFGWTDPLIWCQWADTSHRPRAIKAQSCDFRRCGRGNLRRSGAWPRASWDHRQSWPPEGHRLRCRACDSACLVCLEERVFRSRRTPWPRSVPRSHIHPGPASLSPFSSCGEAWKQRMSKGNERRGGGNKDKAVVKEINKTGDCEVNPHVMSSVVKETCSMRHLLTSLSCWVSALCGGISPWRFRSCPSWGRRVWRIQWPWSEKRNQRWCQSDHTFSAEQGDWILTH